METSNVGGKRKWRKKDLMIKIRGKKKEKLGEIETKAKQTKTRKNRTKLC